MNFSTGIRFVVLFAICIVASSFKPKTNNPIHWINKTFNVNFDTTTMTTKPVYQSYSPFNNDVYFEFENRGNHVTFLDGSAENSLFKTRGCITKPGETNVVTVYKESFPFYKKKWSKKDTVNKLLIPFYYEGESFIEEVEVHFTFGRSKLITFDQLEFDLTDSISKLVEQYKAQDKHLSFKFTREITIKNKTNTTIFCSKGFVAWNDAQYLKDIEKMIPIKPGETYKLPVELNMGERLRFKCNGYIQVKSGTISERHFCEFVSKYTY